MNASIHSMACGPPRFETGLDAWVLTRYADVTAALLDDRFVVPGGTGEQPDTHRKSRVAAGQSLDGMRSPGSRAWLRSSAKRAANRLPRRQVVDLFADLAAPWSLRVAARVVGLSDARAHELVAPARDVFEAAARATSPGFPPDALEATATLTHGLGGNGGIVDVQSFVALSRTLPCALAGAWHVLLEHPSELDRLRSDLAAVDRTVDELLRLAATSRAIFRRAVHAVELGGVRIQAGDTVILGLAAANHDPVRFPDPGRLDPDRAAGAHLGFGRGRHGCPGARLVRSAVAAATEALLASVPRMERAGAVEWTGGFAIRGPVGLPVVLDPAPESHNEPDADAASD